MSSPSPSPSSSPTKGSMLLVGAGPGAVELLTLRAVRALQQADLVLADRLVPRQVLALASCEVRVARKRCGKADLAQAELDAWGLQALHEGKRVVRLKNGDPFLYGRGGEEAVVYTNAGFDVDVVPGLSSALTAPLSAGIPATMRDVADQLLICTGHGKADRFPNLPDYCAHRTTVFLMAIGRLEGLCHSLMTERGFPDDVPAAVVHAATTERMVTVRSSLREIAREVKKRGIEPPGTLVIGGVVTALAQLPHYAAVQHAVADVAVAATNKYEISYPPLALAPEVDLGEHIVLNAGKEGSAWPTPLACTSTSTSASVLPSISPSTHLLTTTSAWRGVLGSVATVLQLGLMLMGAHTLYTQWWRHGNGGQDLQLQW